MHSQEYGCFSSHGQGLKNTSVKSISMQIYPPPSLPSPAVTQPSQQVHHPNQHGYLNQWPNRCRKSFLAVGSKSRNGHRDRQLKIIARSCKALRASMLVPEAQFAGDPQRDEEDADKIHQHRRGDADDRDDLSDDLLALRCEEDDDGVKKTDQRPRPEVLEEGLFIPLRADKFAETETSDDGSAEGDAEEDADTDGYGVVRQSSNSGIVISADDADKEDCKGGEEDHLQHRVDSHKNGTVLRVTSREAVPDEHHGDAASQTDEDETGSQVGFVGEESPCEGEHEERRDNPVHEDAEGQLFPEGLLAEDVMECLVADVAENGIHHDQQADCCSC